MLILARNIAAKRASSTSIRKKKLGRAEVRQ
jgi:hypothetical protein